MNTLDRKQKVRLGRAIAALCKPDAYVPHEHVTSALMREHFGREIKLPSGRWLYLNETGLGHFKDIVSTVHKTNVFVDKASYSDIWSAVECCICDMVTTQAALKGGDDLLAKLSAHVLKDVCLRTYVVTVHGVDMTGINSLQLGSLQLVVPSGDVIASREVADPDGWLHKHLKEMGQSPWLIGSFAGTESAARHRFEIQARLAVGMLAIAAAATHVQGAHAFRINAVFSAEDNHRSSTSLFWDDVNKYLGYSRSMGHVQQYKLGEPISRDLMSAEGFKHAFEVFERRKQNELEAAIDRAVFWFADAHRDAVPVMRLIKYWSCIEGFFTVTKDDITENVSTGMAAVLTFGGYGFLQATDYQPTKAKIRSLYGDRSTAVHRASHDHVSEKDVATLSQWTSWLIINMIAITEEGHSKLTEVLAWAHRMDALHSGKQ